jgi:hypothetical protein
MKKQMKISEAINMACMAVGMDQFLDMKTKHSIIDALAKADELARIGEATQEMFGSCEEVGMITTKYDPINDDEYAVCKTDFLTIEDLLKWAESRDNNG